MLKKLVAGVLLATVAVTAVAPATVSAAGSQNMTERLLTMNDRAGKFSILLTAATCKDFGSVVTNLLSGVDQEDVEVPGLGVIDLPGIKNGTLFAPTDGAFAKSLPGVTDPCDRSQLPADVLIGVLLDHVAYDRITRWDLARQALRNGTVDTIGGPVDVSGRWFRPKLGSYHRLNEPGVRDKALVVSSRGANNGVIHIVDRVIIQR